MAYNSRIAFVRRLVACARFSRALLLAIFLTTVISVAGAKPSAELERAVEAAARARATPKGEAYAQAANLALRDAIGRAIKDCGVMNAPGVRLPPGFQAVLIISSSGKLKWVIRDSSNPMGNCFLSKVVGVTFPPPPADNWPVLFAINMKR
jgi:hypothetical protein